MATPRKRAAEGHDASSHPSRAFSYRTWQNSESVPLKRSDSAVKTDMELLERETPEPHRQTDDFDGKIAALDASIKADPQKPKMSEQRIRKEALAKQLGQILRNVFHSVTNRSGIKLPRKQAVSLRLAKSPTTHEKENDAMTPIIGSASIALRTCGAKEGNLWMSWTAIVTMNNPAWPRSPPPRLKKKLAPRSPFSAKFWATVREIVDLPVPAIPFSQKIASLL